MVNTPNPSILPYTTQCVELASLPASTSQSRTCSVLHHWANGWLSNRPYFPSTPVPSKKSMSSALAHPSVVDNYLQAELNHNRIAGPFPLSQCQEVHISRFGVIPKGHNSNKWGLIVDLSHPSGCSVNDHIPKSLCSLSYITVDDAVQNILKYGQHTFLAKVDIKSAFRLIPVHPADIPAGHVVAQAGIH